MTLWANIVSGSVAGVVSGLIISATLWFINHFNRPKFEFFHVGGNAGHFYYNRLRPIIIGGSFVICHGPALYERNSRGGDGGFYLGPKGTQVFSTGFTQGFISPGEAIDFTYRYAPVRYLVSLKARQEAYLQRMDPIELNSIAGDQNWLKGVGSKGGRWRQARVVMAPSATK
jgi:hypothetical protein